MVTMLLLILLPAAFLLPPGTGAGEIIGGREARPHSRPYMAYLEIQVKTTNTSCGGFLVAKNFVLTAAHCQADHITAYLGVHKITKQERSTQRIPVRRQIPHPRFNRKNSNNDIMLLQLGHRAMRRWVSSPCPALLSKCPQGPCAVSPAGDGPARDWPPIRSERWTWWCCQTRPVQGRRAGPITTILPPP